MMVPIPKRNAVGCVGYRNADKAALRFTLFFCQCCHFLSSFSGMAEALIQLSYTVH